LGGTNLSIPGIKLRRSICDFQKPLFGCFTLLRIRGTSAQDGASASSTPLSRCARGSPPTSEVVRQVEETEKFRFSRV
jgi:hypothetical protein